MTPPSIRFGPLVIAAAILSGALLVALGGRFEIVSSGGTLYRLDRITGDVCAVYTDKIKKYVELDLGGRPSCEDRSRQ